MKSRRISKILILLVTMMLLAAACAQGEDEGDGQGQAQVGEPRRGGTYRLATPAYEWTGSFDPSAEYLAAGWAIYTNLMHRTLLTYPHIAGQEGNRLVPDIARSMPKLSRDRLTYTFKLKKGIRFSPPINREITSRDIKYSFQRIATPSVDAQYAFYYVPYIRGMQDFADGRARDIAGIQTPDARTIRFRLTQPVGDFLYRLAMPATAPIPREVARCFTKAGEYGRYQITTGPYMLQGSRNLKTSTCRSMRPIPGFDPNRHVKLERNPRYNPATDDPKVRENFVDRWELTLNTNTQDIFDKIEAGELEGELGANPPPQVLRRYAQDSNLRRHLHVGLGDRTWYIFMNLTQPPFDDIHVRKAANYAVDKQGLRRAWGGPIYGEIATHIVPDLMLEGRLDNYDPYRTENFEGNLDAAKKEMRQSKYDSNKDGVCDASACRNILHITRSTPPWTEMVPVIEDSFSSIGLQLTTREFEDSYPIVQDVSRNVPIGSNAGWGKDYADPSTFMVLFDSRNIIPTGNTNYSLIGIDRGVLARLRRDARQARPPVDFKFTGTIKGVPHVDARIDRCVKTPAQKRLDCWAALDRHLMEEVVPWVPYLDAKNVDITGPAVTKYEFDQFSTEAGWAHVAVDPSRQRGL